MSGDDILEGLAIVMAHPDDEVLWASSALRAAEKIIVIYGEWPGAPIITKGRREAMEAFPVPTLDWLAMPETGVFDSASWPEVRETEYGLYPHPSLRVLENFNAKQYRAQFGKLREVLRSRLVGFRNVIAHGPWGEYGHEEHVQVFRVVASLAAEMGFRLWVPAYVAPKSEALMLRNLKYCGAPSRPLPIDAAFAQEICDIYSRTQTWTWFDGYVWPETERFLPWQPDGKGTARVEDLHRIVFPADYESVRREQLKWTRETLRRFLSWRVARQG